MCATAAKYATRESLIRRGCPDVKWLTDMTYKWNVTLAGETAKAEAITATREAAAADRAVRDAADRAEQKRLQAELDAVNKRLKTITDHVSKKPRVEGGGKGGGKGGGRGGGKGGGQHGGKPDPPPQDTGPKEWDGRSRKAQQTHLLDTIGKKDGQVPVHLLPHPRPHLHEVGGRMQLPSRLVHAGSAGSPPIPTWTLTAI
jgi:hypothetical protein